MRGSMEKLILWCPAAQPCISTAVWQRQKASLIYHALGFPNVCPKFEKERKLNEAKRDCIFLKYISFLIAFRVRYPIDCHKAAHVTLCPHHPRLRILFEGERQGALEVVGTYV